MTTVKVCGDPHCEAIFHNCKAKDTRCLDCDGRIISINEATYNKKYKNNYFQYDYQTGKYCRPEQPSQDNLQIDLFNQPE